MNPDINNLRRDLGFLPSSRTPVSRSATVGVESEPFAEPSRFRISLNGAGVWALTLLGGAIAVWLLADPILALLAFVWKVVSTILAACAAVLMLCALGAILAAFD